MKIIFCLTFCLFTIFCSTIGALHQAMAKDPLINITAENEPLGDILETITQDTGYQFNLNKEWTDYPVSATIDNLPLERGLKRLLRSLNHTTIWESDKLITIKIFGKVDPKRPIPTISPPLPARSYQPVNQPVAEPESAYPEQAEPTDITVEETETNGGGEEQALPEPGNDESAPQEGTPDEAAEQNPSETDAPPDDTPTES